MGRAYLVVRTGGDAFPHVSRALPAPPTATANKAARMRQNIEPARVPLSSGWMTRVGFVLSCPRSRRATKIAEIRGLLTSLRGTLISSLLGQVSFQNEFVADAALVSSARDGRFTLPISIGTHAQTSARQRILLEIPRAQRRSCPLGPATRRAHQFDPLRLRAQSTRTVSLVPDLSLTSMALFGRRGGLRPRSLPRPRRHASTAAPCRLTPPRSSE